MSNELSPEQQSYAWSAARRLFRVTAPAHPEVLGKPEARNALWQECLGMVRDILLASNLGQDQIEQAIGRNEMTDQQLQHELTQRISDYLSVGKSSQEIQPAGFVANPPESAS